jgi:murein DD-endopeptidase MepM/ murein hydrolase activator NlpD
MNRNGLAHLIFCFILLILLSGLFTMAYAAELSAPMDGVLKYPFEKETSIRCRHWSKKSQDYPYFGAPRNGNKRSHAGVDLYPASGAGTLVKAMKGGSVLKVAPFYVRANGEVTYGVLVDHGDLVANYAELGRPDVTVSSRLIKGQIIGSVSGTSQLHLEIYTAGTKDWTRGWYGQRPANLLDPTAMVLEFFPDKN